MDELLSSKWRINPIIKYGGLLILFVGLGYLVSRLNYVALGAALGLALVSWALVIIFKYPRVNIYAMMLIGFFMAALSRYIPVDITYSLLIDSLLIMSLLVLALKHWHNADFSLARSFLIGLLSLWMGYIILQVFNPEAQSITAWFYVMRGLALYPLLMSLVGLILFNTRKDLKGFLILWFGLTLLGVLWAMKQKFFGVSVAEQQWLNAGAASTHILFGKLRIFSYYFDAGTFGSAMGQASISSLILFLGPFRRKLKIAFLIIGLLSFYGMMLSGTRGALAIPVIGAITYLIMVRKMKLLALGAVVLFAGYFFLKHSTVGQANYDINRMRTALNPEDASLNLRMINRAALTDYLNSRPLNGIFGGGLGTAGHWGRRFSPNTWLGGFSTDGLYTHVRAETGIVGRNLLVVILLLILFKGISISWKLKNPKYQYVAMAFLAGYSGVLMANYGNSVMTQFPTNLICFFGLAFVYNMRYWNEEGVVELPDRPAPVDGKRITTSSWD